MEVAVASVVRRLASRVRRGVSRRVNGVLERVGVRDPAPAPAAARPAPEPEPLVVRATSNVPTPEPAPAAQDDTGGAPLLTRAQVEELFEEMVRPALQSDGGDITLVRVEDNDVYVELVGACHSCPSSIVTMQDGIERLLREEFPHFGRLVRVDAAS